MSAQEAMAEAAAAKAEYLQLFEQFKLSNQLFEEREVLYRQQVEHYKLECEALRKTSLELRYEVRLQRSARKAFEKDVMLLEQTSQMLENKEIGITNRLEDVTARNNKLEVENASLISDNAALRKTMKDDMIGVEEHHNLSRRIEAYEIKIASTVPREAHAKVADKLADLKKRVENEFVSLEEYNRLRERHALDQASMAAMVPVRDYNKLLFKYEALEAQLQDMVPREKLGLLADKLAEVQRHVENDMVGLPEYREALASSEKLRAQIEAQAEEARRREADSVPVRDYNKLLFKYEALQSRVGEDYVPKEGLGRAKEALAELQHKVGSMMSAEEYKKAVATAEALKVRLEREQARCKDALDKLAASEGGARALQERADREGRAHEAAVKAHEAAVKAIKKQYERLHAQVEAMQEANCKLHDGSVAEYEAMIGEMAGEMRDMRRQAHEASVDQRVLEDLRSRAEAAELAADSYRTLAEDARAQLLASRRDLDMVHSAVALSLLQEEGLALDGAKSSSPHRLARSPSLDDYFEADGDRGK